MACGGDDFHKKFQILEKKKVHFFLSHLIFFMLLLLLHKPSKAVGTFRALLWYEQSCYDFERAFISLEAGYNKYRIRLLRIFKNEL